MISRFWLTKPGGLRVREEHRAGDDQRILVLLAELLPERDVLEDRLVAFEILFVADLAVGRFHSGAAGGWLAGAASASAAAGGVLGSPTGGCCGAGVEGGGSAGVWPGPPPVVSDARSARPASLTCSRAMSTSGSTSASMTRSVDLLRSWLRSRRTVSRFPSTSSDAAADEAGDEDARERRDVHLRLDGRLDRNLVEVRAADGGAQQDEASDRRGVSGSGH